MSRLPDLSQDAELRALVQDAVARCVRSSLAQFRKTAQRQALRAVLAELGGDQGLPASSLAWFARLRSQLATRLADSAVGAERDLDGGLRRLGERLTGIERLIVGVDESVSGQLATLSERITALESRPAPLHEEPEALEEAPEALEEEPEALEEVPQARRSPSRRPYGEGASADSAVNRVANEDDASAVRFLQELVAPPPATDALEKKLDERLLRLEGRVEEVLRRLGELATFRPSSKGKKRQETAEIPRKIVSRAGMSPLKSGVLGSLLKQNISFRKKMRSDEPTLPKETKGLLPVTS